MQPYLESLPDHIHGAPPWTPTNRGHEITSRPLKHDLRSHLEISRIYALTIDQSHPNNQGRFIMHIHILCQPLLPIPFMF